MALGIALPSRTLSRSGPDRARRWPRPLGGDNGSVAVPSRTAAAEGRGVREAPGPNPPIDGARGAIPSLLAYLPGWSWSPPSSRRLATPRGYAQALYIRQAMPMVQAIARFVPPVDGRTAWTTNTSTVATTPASPIPYSRRRVVQSFTPTFDTRLWTVYAPREKIQEPQGARRVKAPPTRRMVPGSPDFLTRLAPTVSYGQQTAVVGG